MTSTIASTTYTVGQYVNPEHYGEFFADWCGVTSPNPGRYTCSIPQGVPHTEHVAAQNTLRIVDVWPNTEASPTFPLGGTLPEELWRTDGANRCSVYEPGGNGRSCSRLPRHTGQHVSTDSVRQILAVWDNEAATPEPEPEDEVTAYKREVKAMAERKLGDSYGTYGSWNAALKRLGIEPITVRRVRIVAPIQRVSIDLGVRTEEQAREWLASRNNPATLAGYLRPEADDLGEAEVVVEESTDLDENLDADEDYRATTTDLDTYKELVKEVADDLQRHHGWCDDGTNTVLRELGIDVERNFRVEVQIRAYQTVYVSVTATDADAAIRMVDRSDISNRIDSSEWEWDGDWESDDIEAEEE